MDLKYWPNWKLPFLHSSWWQLKLRGLATLMLYYSALYYRLESRIEVRHLVRFPISTILHQRSSFQLVRFGYTTSCYFPQVACFKLWIISSFKTEVQIVFFIILWYFNVVRDLDLSKFTFHCLYISRKFTKTYRFLVAILGNNMDIMKLGLNDWVTCPFDPVHRLKYSKFHNHFVKCRAQHPEDQRKPCPYNYSELIEPKDWENHLINCSYKVLYVSNGHSSNDYPQYDAPCHLKFG